MKLGTVGRSGIPELISSNRVAVCWAVTAIALAAGFANAADETGSAASAAPTVRPLRTLDLWEIVVDGNTVLDDSDIQEVLLPFLGPNRVPEDVDHAREALEKLYADQGFKTVSVTIPRQAVKDGTVMLTVTEGRIRRLKVVGSKYHSPERIRRMAGSIAEGRVPDFNALQDDLVALNSATDLSVTPSLQNGPTPGSMDADLVVADKLPLHGMLELNNRYSQNTSHRRVSASASYDNLWQRGDSAALFFQTAPDRASDGKVFLANYVFRFDRKPYTLQLNALRTDSDVATVGGIGVVGKGCSVGLRGNWQLIATPQRIENLSLGFDAKNFQNRVQVGGSSSASPLRYYPVSLNYARFARYDTHTLQFDATLNFAFANLGSSSEQLNLTRYHSTGQMLYLRSSLAYNRFLPKGFELAARTTVQLSEQPLISNEQLSAGGMDSVRGYLESEAQGDYGATGGLELRGPSLPDLMPEGWVTRHVQEFRPFIFADGASLHLHQALADNDPHVDLLSMGAGMSMSAGGRYGGLLDWSRLMTAGPNSPKGDNRVLFRLWTNF
ncbi:hemolysin activation/secretion protein [Fluviicoccus keumensis]|uniref:Hemolysin activation/secretion protein n=1 Tax=Fluviicoccus keumensis TaxID=1435465 RepID=A0A4V6MG05_9GAMM|nr:hemolysin activation/secretion protein [Fluviicoccus keumensis]